MSKSYVNCFTSITVNYLPKARVLAQTIKQHHPDWRFTLALSDRIPDWLDFDLAREPFDDFILIEELDIPNLHSWIFKHSIVEICTAVKGQVAWELLNRGAGKVIYFDPDMAVFNPMPELEEALDTHPVVLVPHQLEPDHERDAIIDNEICSLKHGVFNLGFAAVNSSSEGQKFAKWWRNRLLEFCYDDKDNGLFTDQKWCDLAPVFFPDLFIWRDPGCDVASWNLSKRNVELSDSGTVLVNDSPLKFYHFTSFDSGIGHVMTTKYAGQNVLVHEIWAWYRNALDEAGHQQLSDAEWFYGSFDDGTKISSEARSSFRQQPDIQSRLYNPFSKNSE